MAHNNERAAGQQPPEQQHKIEIGITPDPSEVVVFKQQPDGRFKLSFTGRTEIIFPPQYAAELPLSHSNAQQNSVTPESTPSPVSEPHSALETASDDASPTEQPDTPEDENRKFEIVGNVVFEPSYKVRRSGKKIADFALATHPDEETTEYFRIRAFDKRAEYVRDHVHKSQKEVSATVYGPKHWQGRKKTKDGWMETTVTGYYAGFVKVPKKYREKPEGEPAL